MMWWNHGGWGAGDWLAMSFMMVVFWGLLIALVVWLVRGNRSDRGRADPPASDPTRRADDELANQFALGKIDENEFSKRRQVLHKTSRR